jgi:general stress protein 26
MANLSLSDISEKMREIDFAVLSTRTAGGEIAGRPMSNNRQVEYDGDSYFFTFDDTGTVKDIRNDPNVGLSYQARSGFLNMGSFFITIEGRAEVIRDREAFVRHWTPDLDKWFEQGVETPGLVLVKVKAERLHYWDGRDEGDIALTGAETGPAAASRDERSTPADRP